MYFWCSRCSRAFASVEEYPLECYFPDCEAGIYDIQPWEAVQARNPALPEIPEPGKKYPAP
jgi:hypothetical protein